MADFDYVEYLENVEKLKDGIEKLRIMFRKARVEQAQAEYAIDEILSRRIEHYRSERANVGIRMIIITAINDQRNPERDLLRKMHRQFIDKQAEAEILKVEINCFQGELIALQSIVKHGSEGERYSIIP